ncbi:MAG: hypothetical protein H6721_11360 [Sandaracinus sp.]|nr:hypothetical protein [Sandaracinus sp.]MCB9612993.1 hypothetical protein [Sandaracinus sp.]MCB9619137.1 hypothetical protein [Sandaracinus sp.]MCB9632720.1 hypothetical protein [Sandaracinus sp.]
MHRVPWVVSSLLVLGTCWMVGCGGSDATCPTGFEPVDGACMCVAPRVLDASRAMCVCPGNLISIGRSCECPAGLVLDESGSQCVCPDGRVASADSCVCPAGEEERADGSCGCAEGNVRSADGDCECIPPTVRGTGLTECVCPAPLEPSGATCACPAPLVAMGNSCVCPETWIPDDALGCACPEHAAESRGLCVCDVPRTRAGDSCVCPEDMLDRDGACVCPDGFLRGGESCIATFCTLPSADCDEMLGCETDLSTSAASCGLCGAGCTGTCEGGVCSEARPVVVFSGEAPTGTTVELLNSVPVRSTVAAEGTFALEVPFSNQRPWLRFTNDEYAGLVVANYDLPTMTEAYTLDRAELDGYSLAAGVTQASDRGVLVVVVVRHDGLERVELRLTDRFDAVGVAQRSDGVYVAPTDAQDGIENHAWLNVAPGRITLETSEVCSVVYGGPYVVADTSTLMVLSC